MNNRKIGLTIRDFEFLGELLKLSEAGLSHQERRVLFDAMYPIMSALAKSEGLLIRFESVDGPQDSQ